MIRQDLPRYLKKGGSSSFLRNFFLHPGFRFMVLHRMCNRYASFHPLGILARWWHGRLKVKFGFQIPHVTKIGKGFFLGHFGNIVINQGVKIGSNCNVAQGVTIGQVNRGEKVGCPTIGDRVWIGANAVIVGNIKIGNDVLIAPLSYVSADVPHNAVVAGNPAKVISFDGTTGYINNPVG